MLPVLHRKYAPIKSSYHSLKANLLKEDEERLNISPAPGKWSVLQIMTHLEYSETISLQFLKKKMNVDDLPVTGSREAFRSLLLRWALLLPLKFKAPEVVRINIPDHVKSEELFKKFDSTRMAMEEFLSDFPSDKLNLAIFKHPRIGYINIIQTLDFIQAHFKHHENQIRSILKK